MIISCQDEDKIRQKYSVSKVLRTIQVQTESFLMILIQTHILCHTFQADREESWAQFCLAMISILNLARDCAEHHFHEISGTHTHLSRNRKPIDFHFVSFLGKSLIPFCYQVFPTLLFYFTQILLRLPSLALLTLYLGDWFGLFLAAILPIHYTLASMNLRTLAAKNVWTGLLSTLAPICFVARDKIKDHICKLSLVNLSLLTC